MKKKSLYAAALIAAFAGQAIAGEADVVNVEVGSSGETAYNFAVTVRHADTGWEHYADKWDILDDKGNILATRVLHHPHVNEQPFTRSLSGVEIPQSITKVNIRAHDSVHGYGGKGVTVDLR